jgi:hypothetical protein
MLTAKRPSCLLLSDERLAATRAPQGGALVNRVVERRFRSFVETNA